MLEDQENMVKDIRNTFYFIQLHCIELTQLTMVLTNYK